MEQLSKLVEVYEKSNTAFVRYEDIDLELTSPWEYLRQQEDAAFINVQWTQHPKIKLTELGYKFLKSQELKPLKTE